MILEFDTRRVAANTDRIRSILEEVNTISYDLADDGEFGVGDYLAEARGAVEDIAEIGGLLVDYLQARIEEVTQADRLGFIHTSSSNLLGQLAAAILQARQPRMTSEQVDAWIVEHSAMAHLLGGGRQRTAEDNAQLLEHLPAHHRALWWRQMSDDERAELIELRPDLAVGLLSTNADFTQDQLNALANEVGSGTVTLAATAGVKVAVPLIGAISVTGENGVEMVVETKPGGTVEVTMTNANSRGITAGKAGFDGEVTQDTELNLTWSFSSMEEAQAYVGRVGRSSVNAMVQLGAAVSPVVGLYGIIARENPGSVGRESLESVVQDFTSNLKTVDFEVGNSVSVTAEAGSGSSMGAPGVEFTASGSAMGTRSFDVHGDDDYIAFEIELEGEAEVSFASTAVPSGSAAWLLPTDTNLPAGAGATVNTSLSARFYDDGRKSVILSGEIEGEVVTNGGPLKSKKGKQGEFEVEIEINDATEEAVGIAMQRIAEGATPASAFQPLADAANIKVSTATTGTIGGSLDVELVEVNAEVKQTTTTTVHSKSAGGEWVSSDEADAAIERRRDELE